MHSLLLATLLALALRPARAAPAPPPPSLEDKLRSHKFAFVIGAHHSGTSVLKSILQQHPSISAHGTASSLHESWVDEGQHLQSVYPTAEASGGMQQYGLVSALSGLI